MKSTAIASAATPSTIPATTTPAAALVERGLWSIMVPFILILVVNVHLSANGAREIPLLILIGISMVLQISWELGLDPLGWEVLLGLGIPPVLLTIFACFT